MSTFEERVREVKESWRLMDEHRRKFTHVWRQEGTRSCQVEVPRCQVQEGGRQCLREVGHRFSHQPLVDVRRIGVSFSEPVYSREVSPEFVVALRDAGARESLVAAVEGKPVGLWQKFKRWFA